MWKPIAEIKNKNSYKMFNFLKVYSSKALDLAEETFNELQPKHLAEFQTQPRVRSYPGDYPGGQLPFDTERQRRWYWANIGKPYKRTGRMAKGLEQKINRVRNEVKVTASYPTDSTKYVLGNILGERVRPYQQRFHKVTGWQPAAPVLERHAQSYYDTFVRRYEAWIAFTGRELD